MSVTRRNFLGSVIGLVVGIKFLAKTIEEPPQRVILPYNMYFHETHSNKLLQAPGVFSVERTVVDGSTKCVFKAEALHVTSTLEFDGVALRTAGGVLIGQSKFSGRVPMVCGDTLKCEQTLILDADVTLEEAVWLFTKRKKEVLW